MVRPLRERLTRRTTDAAGEARITDNREPRKQACEKWKRLAGEPERNPCYLFLKKLPKSLILHGNCPSLRNSLPVFLENVPVSGI
jgi:hypothetical protein